MKTANKPSIRQVYISLLCMLMLAAFVQVHNLRQLRASSDPVTTEMVTMQEGTETKKQAESVLEQFAGVLAIPSLVLKTVNQFNGQR